MKNEKYYSKELRDFKILGIISLLNMIILMISIFINIFTTIFDHEQFLQYSFIGFVSMLLIFTSTASGIEYSRYILKVGYIGEFFNIIYLIIIIILCIK